MLTIRQAQMHAFQAERAKEFCRRTAAYLQREFPIATNSLSTEELLEGVSDGLTRAHRYGFVKEASYVAYIALEFTVGPNFDRHPAIHRVLDDARIPPDSRIALLAHEIVPEQWDEARRLAFGESTEQRVAAISGSK